jgi:hypothetical protein
MSRIRSNSAGRAALLLEVVVALAVLVAAMGALGAALVRGLRLTEEADRRTRAAALADRLLALVELDPLMQDRLLRETQTDGDFGHQYPGWFWQMAFEPTEIAGLGLVRVEVLYQEDVDQPDRSEGAVPVRQIALLKAAPGRIDLAKDFGMSEEQVSELATLLPISDFDPTALDPQALVALVTENPEALLELLPTLMPLLEEFAAKGGTGSGTALGPGGMFAQLGQESGGEGGDLAGQLRAALGGAGAGAGQGTLDDLMRLSQEIGAEAAGPTGMSAVSPGGLAGGGRGALLPGGRRADRGGGAAGQPGAPRGAEGRQGRAALAPGRRGGDAGSDAGRGPRAGGTPGAGTPPRGVARGEGRRGTGGGASPRGAAGQGNAPRGTAGQGNQPQHTIEDLLRMRDEMQRQQGGR